MGIIRSFKFLDEKMFGFKSIVGLQLEYANAVYGTLGKLKRYQISRECTKERLKIIT